MRFSVAIRTGESADHSVAESSSVRFPCAYRARKQAGW